MDLLLGNPGQLAHVPKCASQISLTRRFRRVRSQPTHALKHGPDLRENVERPVRPFRKIHHLSRPEQPVDKAVDLLPPHTSDMFEPLSGLRDIKPRQAKGMLAVLMGRESVPEPHHQGPTSSFAASRSGNSGSSPPQRALTWSRGDAPRSGDAMLPRKRVRTAWNGVGQP